MLNRQIGPYRIEAFIGAGGMGQVYRARHQALNRTVAIKRLTVMDYADRFANEARVHAGLQHPNIAGLYELLDIDGRPAIALEFVPGPTLDQHIGERGMMPDDAVQVFRKVVEAVKYLHGKGIVHRDIKPHNIKARWTDEGWKVKLLDFGIAKDRQSPKLTSTGLVVGTLDYLAPEQLGGRTSLQTDVWALGVLFYEMLTGHPPFQSENALELYNQISRAIYAPASAMSPTAPPWADTVIASCLKKKPAARYQTAAGLADALTAYVTAPHRTISLQPDLMRRIGFGSLGLAGVLILGVLFWPSSEPDVTPDPPPEHSRAVLRPDGVPPLNSPEGGPVQPPEGTRTFGTISPTFTDPDSVTIRVLNAPEAYIVLQGRSYQLPFTIHGERGSTVAFDVGAPGYESKRDLQVTIASYRRKEYAFPLQKTRR
ncbi:MAG: serine/threonine-protein kinase [Bacteroidota bacterium]